MKPESLPNASKLTAFARRLMPALVAVVFVGIAACGDDDDPIIDIPEDFDLTFSGDDSFSGAHAGQDIYVVVEDDTGAEVASDNDVVADVAAGESSFTFTFEDILDEDETYVIKYVIDSNFNDGTAGTCDEPNQDHQWELTSTDVPALASVSADVTHEEDHRPGDSTENLCASFDFGTA